MLRRDFLLASAALALTASANGATAQACTPWPQWQAFVQRHVQDDGRVVDHSVANQQSTSESQSYGMFFALVANDRERFAKIWRWSRDNLGAGSDRLPAWQWGKRDNGSGSYGVLDPNSASDADLWFAYDLLEAARLWRLPEYQKAGMALLAQIRDKEIVDAPGLGTILLPGPEGFVSGQQYRLNPSYLPLPLLRKLARVDTGGPWNGLIATSLQVLRQSSPKGFAPDWALYDAAKGFLPDTQTQAVGSYDAIRVYLWAGVTDNADPQAQSWRDSLAGMARHVAAYGAPPEKIDTAAGTTEGKGPVGFSAALLPYLQSMGQDAALRAQLLLMQDQWSKSSDIGYYNMVLALFGWGWQQGRYRFGADGDLQPAWLSCIK